MKIIGITGVIASGKTLISKYLKGCGYQVFDADEEVKKIYRNETFLKRLKKFFPSVFINGKAHKPTLAGIVFKDKKKLKELQELIHPLVEKECNNFIKRNKKNNEKIIFLDIPLLFEVNWDKKCDYAIVISVEYAIQKARFLASGKTEEDFKHRRHSQLLNCEKVARANFVVENNGSKTNTYKQVDKIINKLII
jgi:dephospho-CoA kinase